MRRRRDWQLVDGGVTIVDDLVLRPAHPWTPTIHALLDHLRGQGLTSVPEPVGIEGDVEAVRFIPGDAGRDCWRHQWGEDGVRSAARLLREIHDATRGFVAPDDAEWALPPVPGSGVVCHGDPGPWNMVWDGSDAIALIDWDLAHPAPAMDDVAHTLEYVAPFRNDDFACDDRDGYAFPESPDRRSRIAAFASAYGLGSTPGLVDRVIDRQGASIEYVQYLAGRRVQPQRAWVEAGFLDDLRGRVRWTRENRHLFE
ncbi:MAG: aminoglycoside phosphotransferase family protein [Nocardioides sp.]